MGLKRWLHNLGLIDSSWADARDGEYKNVFCPHCGEFIPERYRVLVESTIGADDGMTFDCENCGRSGAVFAVMDYEPIVDPGDTVSVGQAVGKLTFEQSESVVECD